MYREFLIVLCIDMIGLILIVSMFMIQILYVADIGRIHITYLIGIQIDANVLKFNKQ